MPCEQNYTLTARVGEDGTQYLLIREARNRPARHGVSALAESMTILKTRLQKALRLARHGTKEEG